MFAHCGTGANVAVGDGSQAVVAYLRRRTRHSLQVEAKLTGKTVMGSGVTGSASKGRTMQTSKPRSKVIPSNTGTTVSSRTRALGTVMLAHSTHLSTIYIHPYLTRGTGSRICTGGAVEGTGRASTCCGHQVTAKLTTYAVYGSCGIVIQAGLAASDISTAGNTGPARAQPIPDLAFQAVSRIRTADTVINTGVARIGPSIEVVPHIARRTIGRGPTSSTPQCTDLTGPCT